ncbi:MAG: M20/M25/M40 family metallo-hydrolase [Gemmatimonadales bacterium]|nr:M20/M25/M40 family metallo-hydrolase [Gemmatimonadales bacterium]
MRRDCLLGVAMLALWGPAVRPAATQVQPTFQVNPAAMDAHMRFLSSDLLEGRAPATRGGRLAVEYIAAVYRFLGLEPAAADSSYFQPVALVGMMPQPTFTWGKAGATTTLAFRDDYVAWGERPEADITAAGEVVFVGYGIRAPEWQWDDFKGTDLRGKILLMLVNDPGMADSTVFLGDIFTYYGRWTYKLEEAARQGAAGVVLIHTTESATYPWEVVRGSWSVEQLKLDQPQSPSLAFAGWVTEQVALDALARAGFPLDSLTRAAARRDFRPVATGIQTSVRVQSALRRVQSENVVARLRGSDPRVASQVVLFTSHWDHKGIGPVVRGDSIYNGAEDNASGIAAMLAAAQALTGATPRPRRSILFVATTAEESGLLGSEAYVQRPLVPLAQTAAVVNIDVTNVRGATEDISALGLDRSSLGPVFETAARAERLTVESRPDVRGSFFRSDHFPFARAGVPALSLRPGVRFVGRPSGWGEEQETKYNAERYHQPSDEHRTDFRFDGMAQQVRVAVRVALAVANSPSLPRWLPTSEFQRPRP